MADQNPRRELVFCHSCENEWFKDSHGLECPMCHSEAVEIIDPESDPRENTNAGDPLSQPSSPPSWTEDPPDPDEGDIDRVEWTGPGGVRFSRTTFRSSPGGPGNIRGPGSQTPFDPFGPFLSTMMGGQGPRSAPTQPQSPRSGGPEGGARFGGNITFSTMSTGSGPRTSTFRFGNAAPGNDPQVRDLVGIFGQILHGMNPTLGAAGTSDAGRGDEPDIHNNPLAILAHLLNPANARAGDAVFTQEALDRVISSLMDQHSVSTAPGPATEAAISALPKIKISKEHLDANEKAECSICMDVLEIGEEVTELPCKHWFHGDCVSAWLREHDTCPQCRRGITPQDGDVNSPRATGEAPRYWQVDPNNLSGDQQPSEQPTPSGRSNRRYSTRSGSAQSPIQVPDSPPSSSSNHRQQRRDTDNGRSNSGGLAGWVGRRFGGNNTDGSRRQ